MALFKECGKSLYAYNFVYLCKTVRFQIISRENIVNVDGSKLVAIWYQLTKKSSGVGDMFFLII